jgi:hypothetical protein
MSRADVTDALLELRDDALESVTDTGGWSDGYETGYAAAMMQALAIIEERLER